MKNSWVQTVEKVCTWWCYLCTDWQTKMSMQHGTLNCLAKFYSTSTAWSYRKVCKIPNNYTRIHNWAIFMADTLNDQLPWRLTKAIVPCMGKFFTLKWNLLCRWGLKSQHIYCTLHFPQKMMKNFAHYCCKSSNQYHCMEESNFFVLFVLRLKLWKCNTWLDEMRMQVSQWCTNEKILKGQNDNF